MAMCCGGVGGAPPDDPVCTRSVQDVYTEVSRSGLSDKYYVNGLGLSWTSPTDEAPSPLSGIDRAIWGDGQQRVAFSVVQQIYTPADTHRVVPDPNDRPYAGVLLANLGLLNDTDSSRSVIRLSVGLVGPDSGRGGVAERVP